MNIEDFLWREGVPKEGPNRTEKMFPKREKK